MNREQLLESSLQPSFSQALPSLGVAGSVLVGALVVVVAAGVVVGVSLAALAGGELVVGSVEASSVSAVEAAAVVELTAVASPSVVSAGAWARLFATVVERVSRLSAGVVERPGSKPSSSVSGANEVGLLSLESAFSWPLFWAPFASPGCCLA